MPPKIELILQLCMKFRPLCGDLFRHNCKINSVLG